MRRCLAVHGATAWPLPMLVEGDCPDANLSRAAAVVQGAAERCWIAILQECLNLGWTYPGTPEAAGPFPPYSEPSVRPAR